MASCSKENTATVEQYAAIKSTFGASIDPANLSNYATQTKPAYIVKDNTTTNPITNSGATLGRVCFTTKTYQKITPSVAAVATSESLPLEMIK